jgi:hypothetical protein
MHREKRQQLLRHTPKQLAIGALASAGALRFKEKKRTARRSRRKRIQPAVSLTPPKAAAGVSAGVTRSILDIKKSAVSVVLNLVNPVLPRGGLEGGVNLGELIKLIVKVLDDVLHLKRG